MAIFIAKVNGGSTTFATSDQTQRNYEASGLASTDTEDTVKAALYTQHSIAKNSLLAVGSALKCQSIQVTIKDGGLADINVSFAIPPTGGSFNDKTDPLNQPLQVQLQPFYLSERTEQDIMGNTMVNGADFPFESGQEIRITGWRLTITKNFATFNWQAWQDWQGVVNDAPVTINLKTNSMVAPADCLKLDSVCPTTGWNKDSVAIPVAFTYEYLKVRCNGTVVDAPWDYRLSNKSKLGWYTKSGGGFDKGPFCNAENKVLSEPVLIDEYGLPIDSSVKVYTKTGAVSAVAFGSAPTGAIAENTGYGVFLRYQKLERKSFSAMAWFGATPTW